MKISTCRLKMLFALTIEAEASRPPSGGSHSFGEGIDRSKSPEELVLKDFTESLTEDEKKDVLALMWLGLGKGFESFDDARRSAGMDADMAYAIRSRSNLLVEAILNGLIYLAK